MPIRSAALAAGTPPQQCNALIGTIVQCNAPTDTGVPLGANQAAATPIPSDMVILSGTSVGSGTGYLLPKGVENSGTVIPGDTFQVLNQGGNAVLVYPNTAGGKVQGGAAGAGFSVANNKQAQFTYMGTKSGIELWAADLSA